MKNAAGLAATALAVFAVFFALAWQHRTIDNLRHQPPLPARVVTVTCHSMSRHATPYDCAFAPSRHGKPGTWLPRGSSPDRTAPMLVPGRPAAPIRA